MSTILVIDDEAGVTRVSRAILERAGHHVVTAENGRVGLQRLQECHPDIVVKDLCMPDISGTEMIQELIRLSPQTRIIAMSGGGRDGTDVLKRAHDLGASAVLQKPFRKAALLAALRS